MRRKCAALGKNLFTYKQSRQGTTTVFTHSSTPPRQLHTPSIGNYNMFYAIMPFSWIVYPIKQKNQHFSGWVRGVATSPLTPHVGWPFCIQNRRKMECERCRERVGVFFHPEPLVIFPHLMELYKTFEFCQGYLVASAPLPLSFLW